MSSDHTPDTAPVALLLVDVINAYDFDGAEALMEHARPAVRVLSALKKRAKAAGVPVIYANDHFGRWRDDFKSVVTRATAAGAPGRKLVEPLVPGPDDSFVLKPKHSAFFGTPLEFLLNGLGTRTLMVAGFASDICVLATLVDARMREYKLVVPSDASAAETATAHSQTLSYARRVLDADTPRAADIDPAGLMAMMSRTEG
jgi:nicotinamidase-related amidase